MLEPNISKRTNYIGEKHLNVDPLCKRRELPESITHLLFHFQYLQQVWDLAPTANGFDPRRVIDLDDIWNSLSGKLCLPPTGLVAGQLTPWILWSLWKDRNKMVFEGNAGTPIATLTSAIVAAKEWDNNALKEKGFSKKSSPP